MRQVFQRISTSLPIITSWAICIARGEDICTLRLVQHRCDQAYGSCRAFIWLVKVAGMHLPGLICVGSLQIGMPSHQGYMSAPGVAACTHTVLCLPQQAAPPVRHTFQAYVNSMHCRLCTRIIPGSIGSASGYVTYSDVLTSRLAACPATPSSLAVSGETGSRPSPPSHQHSHSMRRASVATCALSMARSRKWCSLVEVRRLAGATGLSSFPSRLDINRGCCASSMKSSQYCMVHCKGWRIVQFSSYATSLSMLVPSLARPRQLRP